MLQYQPRLRGPLFFSEVYVAKQTIFVTGVAGFIGFHLSKRLLREGHRVFGIDSINDYYNPQLKRDRIQSLLADGLNFTHDDLNSVDVLPKLFKQHDFERVIHLAAQAGVRYSLTNPHAYVEANLRGFVSILEACRHAHTPHLLFASSSSVYGLNRSMPFSESGGADHPVSMYGATKKANELMAHSYASMYGLPSTGLRFFTVYGPWGRPDMALYIFARAIAAGKPIQLFNDGKMSRDFTYVDDIVDAITRLKDLIAVPNPDWDPSRPDPGTSSVPYSIYNIGSHRPVELAYMVDLIEKNLGQVAQREYLPMQVGDVTATYADVRKLHDAIGEMQPTTIEEGIRRSLDWYRQYRETNPDV
jgi:UDP-glucuronate 4-epimerase